MAMLARGTRRRKASRRAGPSVREVCLLGARAAQPESGWSAGGRVEWSGRAYRITATDGGDRAEPVYLHLEPDINP